MIHIANITGGEISVNSSQWRKAFSSAGVFPDNLYIFLITSTIPQTIKFYVDDSTESEDFQLEADVQTTIYVNCGEGFHNTRVECEDVTALTSLFCYVNKLTSLDVSNLTNLTYLDCSDNKLTELDVSNLTNLECLYCESNQISELDVSNLTNLYYLNCSDNKLTSLNLTDCTSLNEVNAQENNPTPIPTIIGNDDGRITIKYE